jgi:hypothetical protein
MLLRISSLELTLDHPVPNYSNGEPTTQQLLSLPPDSPFHCHTNALLPFTTSNETADQEASDKEQAVLRPAGWFLSISRGLLVILSIIALLFVEGMWKPRGQRGMSHVMSHVHVARDTQ